MPHLTTTTDLSLEPHTRPSPDVDRADAFRAVKLVAADRHEIDVQVVDVDGDLADGLSSVRMEEYLLRSA